MTNKYDGYSWIAVKKVKKYEMDQSKTWEERYCELSSKHWQQQFLLAMRLLSDNICLL
jgi:hypothetical protein